MNTKIPSNARVEAIDIAKGIGIILVYFGHIPPTPDIKTFIYSFHMPLFFFLSGIFMDEKKYDFKSFFISRCKTLLIPLFTFATFSIIVGFIRQGGFHHLQWSGPLWFLYILFFVEVFIFYVWKNLYWISHSSLLKHIVCLSLFVIAFIVDNHHIHLPLDFNVVPLASFFFVVGNLLSVQIKNRLLNSSTRIELLAAFLLLIGIIFYTWCTQDQTNVHKSHIADGIYGYLIAFSGICVTLIVSKYVAKTNMYLYDFLLFCGRNSLVIYGTHYILQRWIGVNKVNCVFNPVLWILLNLAVVASIFVIIYIVNKKAKWCIGRM